jgi:hypothetical protein
MARLAMMPLKRSNNGGQCGTLFDITGEMPTVYLVNVFSVGDMGGISPVINNKGIERIEYESVDALLQDGWRVD